MGPNDLPTSVPKLVLNRIVSFPLPQRPPRDRKGPKQGQQESNPRRGKSIDFSKTEARYDASILSDVDETSIDEVIHNLIELRNMRRPHLPPLQNPLRDNLIVILPPDPSVLPKRGRGRPRIVRNEQVVSPRAALPPVISDIYI